MHTTLNEAFTSTCIYDYALCVLRPQWYPPQKYTSLELWAPVRRARVSERVGPNSEAEDPSRSTQMEGG